MEAVPPQWCMICLLGLKLCCRRDQCWTNFAAASDLRKVAAALCFGRASFNEAAGTAAVRDGSTAGGSEDLSQKSPPSA